MNDCPKSGAKVNPENDLERSGHVSFEQGTAMKKRSCLRSLLITVGIISAVFMSLAAAFPWIVSEMMNTNKRPMGRRATEIVVAINEANRDRAVSGLPPVWPRTVAVTSRSGDISERVFQTSSDYFYEIYDGGNVGSSQHHPYIKGFDYSKLAGVGVPSKADMGPLQAKNNAWMIAANITAEDDPRIPLLITRNMDVKEIERVVNQGLKKSEFKTRIRLSEKHKAPFGYSGFVAVRISGRSLCVNGIGKATLGELFENKELPARDPSKPPIVYLMP